MDYRYNADMADVKRQDGENCDQCRRYSDTSRVLGINISTEINRLKKNTKT